MDQKSRKWTALKIVAIVIIAIGVVFGCYQYFSRDTDPIPREVRSQLTFSPFILAHGSKNYTATQYKFSQVENNLKIFTYVLHLPNGANVSTSQYPLPPEFAEIPEYKNRFLDNVAQQYATVQTANGTIYLGRQVKQQNKQLGVMLERGLLMFLSPDKELSDTDWRSLGDQLEIRRIQN